MNIILLGAPGAGKGTQGVILSERAGLPKIATGDLLRAAVRDGTPLGRQAQEYMDQGLLVPDEIILGLIEEVLASADAAAGVIMDGFPRTTPQAEAVDGFLGSRNDQVDRVVTFEVPDDELIDRMLGRAEEQGRSDDTPEAIRKRLEVYRKQTAPLIEFYERKGIVTEVVAVGTVEDVTARARSRRPESLCQ